MHCCDRAHPGPGPTHSTYVQPWIAVHNMEVEFFGHRYFLHSNPQHLAPWLILRHNSAHAAYAPWEAQNALDAAFLAYSGISVLRQQMKPSYRVHGVVSGKDWEPNGMRQLTALADAATDMMQSFPIMPRCGGAFEPRHGLKLSF